MKEIKVNVTKNAMADNNMPLKVLSLVESGNLIGACRGEDIGTNVIES